MMNLVAPVIVFCAWAGLRYHAKASFRPALSLLLDLVIAIWCWAVASLVTDRLLLGAVITAFGAVGLMIANAAKFEVLRERLAFSDRAELLEVFRHPEMYLPFAGTAIVLSGAAAALVLLGLLEWLERPMLPHAWLAPPALAACAALYFSLAVPQFLKFLGKLFTSWLPAGAPDADIPRFGLLACFVIHATLARFERPTRHAPHAVPQRQKPLDAASTRSVVLVQFESFFDLQRLPDAYRPPRLSLPQLQRVASSFGRLEVPCWGANTIRTEFAALTGIDVRDLGLDQYNPYERFARREVDSLAWEMRSRGARTVCIHPFDLNFYGRARAMPKLGFEHLVGPRHFARSVGYCGDMTIVDRIGQELDKARNAQRPALIFAITIAAHGPWKDAALGTKGAIADYLEAARLMDQTLPQLKELADAHDAMLAIYGDHQPSLPKAFSSIGLTDPRTDYVIYDPRNNRSRPHRIRRDLAAYELRGCILPARQQDIVELEPVAAE